MADHCAEVEKMPAELPTLDENAEAIDFMVTDGERLVRLLIKKNRRHSQCLRHWKHFWCSTSSFRASKGTTPKFFFVIDTTVL